MRMTDEDGAHSVERQRFKAGVCAKFRRTEARLDTITSGLKNKAKSWLAQTPSLYRPISAAFRSLGVIRGMAYLAANRSKIMMGARPILVSYPGEVSARWSESAVGHPFLAKVIGENREEYARLIRTFGAFRGAVEKIADGAPAGSTDPSWINGFFTGLDAFALYGMLSSRRPKRYFEIGSGFSTKLARRAINDQGLSTALLSIDPSPQAKIDSLCDTVFRQRLEDADVTLFDQLEAGDILFFDGSHHAFMSSDVVVFFLEVLPRLRPGVLVHIHDIFLPYDYPAEWTDRYYSEQYLLAMALLAPQRSMNVIFPARFIQNDAALSALVDDQCGPRAKGGGASFWVRAGQG